MLTPPSSSSSPSRPERPEIWFIAIRPFGPERGPAWADYCAWIGRPFLRELVTLDSGLCPAALEPLTPEDWAHNVQADFLIEFFHHFDYLRARAAAAQPAMLLAALREPPRPAPELWHDPRFVFLGYDLVEKPGRGVSALANCGGFEPAFAGMPLSEVGLITAHPPALAARQRLRELFPDEPHADCHVWALWRLAAL